MTVYQLSTGRWRFDFQAMGRRYTRAGFVSRKQALAAQEQERRDVATGRSPVYSTVGDLAVAYLIDSERRKSAEWTYQLRKKLDKGFGHMARFQLSEIRPAHINAALETLAAQGLQASTVNEYRKIIKALFAFGVQMEAMDGNPAAKTRRMAEERTEALIMSTAHLKQIILAAPPDLARFVVVASQTGARYRELARLTWPRVFTTAAEPFAVLATRKKSGGHEATQPQPLTQVAVRAIEAQRGAHAEWVWPAPRGGPLAYRTQQKRLRTITTELEMPDYAFHAIRHWAGFQATAMGLSRKAVAKFLRHESSNVTEVYMHALAPEVWAIARRLEEEVGGDARGSGEGEGEGHSGPVAGRGGDT